MESNKRERSCVFLVWLILCVVSVVAHHDRALRYRGRGAIEVGDIDSDQFADLSQRRFQSLFEGRMIYRKFKHPRCRLAALDSPCSGRRLQLFLQVAGLYLVESMIHLAGIDEDHADQVLATFKTQREAIDWSRKLGHAPLVSRVRHLNDKKKPDHWRAA